MNDEHLDRLIRNADPAPVVPHLDGADRDLLEEIVSEPRLADRRAMTSRAAAWLTAAAVLVGLLTVSIALRDRSGEPAAAPAPALAPASTPASTPAPAPASAPASAAAPIEIDPVLWIDEPGWVATSVYGFATDGTGTVAYVQGKRQLEFTWYPADHYESYYTDRLDVSAPQPVTVAASPGSLFTYSDSDFAVMLQARDGTFAELRTSGPWTRATFDQVLTKVEWVGVSIWQASLPKTVVTPDRAAAVSKDMLADVPLPPGFDKAALTKLGTNDRYQFAAQITGRVGCGWIREFRRATAAKDTAGRQRASEAMGGSRRWAILNEINAGGGWSSSFWELADKIAAGKMPELSAPQIGTEPPRTVDPLCE
jgi:hypothetical protein